MSSSSSCVEFDVWGFIRRSSFKARKAEEEALNEEEWCRYEAECAEEGGLGRDALVRDWEQALRSEPPSSEVLFELMKRGIPRVLRPRVWKILSGYARCKQAAEKRGDTFETLKNAVPSPECSKYTAQIRMDLKRTFPTHRMFLEAKGIEDLFDVLQAYANYDTTVHYCQGMNYLAAMLLIVMGNAEDAFWMFVAVLKGKGTDCFYAPGMPGLVRECDALDAVVHAKLPAVHKCLARFDIAPILFVVPWYNPMFTSINNWCIVMRIWDLFMLEGARALRRASLFFLFSNAEKITNMKFPELLPFLLNPPCRRVSVKDFVRGITEGPVSDAVARAFPVTTPVSTGITAAARRKSPKEKGKQGFFASIIEDNPLAKWFKKTLYPDQPLTASSPAALSTAMARSTTAGSSSRRQRGAAAAARSSPKGVTIAGKVEKRRLSLSGNDVPCGSDSLDGFNVSDVVVAPDQCEDFVTYRGKDWRVTAQNPVSPISLESCKLTRKSTLKRTHSPPYYHSGYDDVVFFNANTDSDDEIPMVTSTSISMDNGEGEGDDNDKSISLYDGDDKSVDCESSDKAEYDIRNTTPTKRRKMK